MLDALHHRGPDARGIGNETHPGATLGHTRLSIIDLEGGDQPLHGAGGSTLVANGEIYNAHALRGELGEERFTTYSDNEAILHLLSDGGPEAASELRGMFAFALTDDDELLLGRDPVGIKPLYVGHLGDSLVISRRVEGTATGCGEDRTAGAGHRVVVAFGDASVLVGARAGRPPGVRPPDLTPRGHRA
ncbi:MAG: hypothetical protein R2789_16760 [Microthrixaceae bacterium]